jgi:hypothetical protein
MPDKELYYIQNKGFCGDCLLWWRVGGKGYTVNLDHAWKVTKEKAYDLCRWRPEVDTAWPVSAVDQAAERHLNSESALYRRGSQFRGQMAARREDAR